MELACGSCSDSVNLPSMFAPSVSVGSAVRNRLVHNRTGMLAWREPVWHRRPLHLLRSGREAAGDDPVADPATFPSSAR